VKEVTPPIATGVSHQRKLHSYQVEASFYENAASSLRDHGLALPHSLLVENTLTEHDGGSMLLVMNDLKHAYPNSCVSLDLEHASAALSWLARFHALYWQQELPPGLWPEGSYWRLSTRVEELEDIELEWLDLKQAARIIDKDLAEGCKFRTLIHGDAKAANFLFSTSSSGNGPVASAYDFQYCGSGDGMRDVAYLMCSSVGARVVQVHEEALLRHYHKELCQLLPDQAAEEYTWEVMQQRLVLATCDFVRFMAGWGWWGNTRWAEEKARECLAQLAMSEG